MKNDGVKIEIRHVRDCDKTFWFSLDRHLPPAEFKRKVRDKQGYVLFANDVPVGILRYNLFWDNTPFCTLLIVGEQYRGRGFGRALMNFWEEEMRMFGYKWVLVSTQTDETAQYFYRKLNYIDCGRLDAPAQAPELFLRKNFE